MTPPTAHPRPRLAVSGPLPDNDLADHVDRVPLHPPDPVTIDGYVLESGSPPRGLPSDAPPQLPAEEAGRLRDPALLEHFAERIFAHARLRELFAGYWRPRDLVAFHSRHKLQILAHDPSAYREMGRIVARSGTRPRETLETDYRRAFNEALSVHPTRGRHTNALLHVFSPLSAHLAPPERHAIVTAIDAYHQTEEPLNTPIALLRHHAQNDAYLTQQTYLNPYPEALQLRHHI